MHRHVMRLGRRIGIAIAGGLVIAAGIVLLPLPGPGSAVILVGLGILSLEFEKPRVWLAHLKAKGVQMKESILGKRSGRRSK